jgi:membrane protease YdiL (CAAX protease family)
MLTLAGTTYYLEERVTKLFIIILISSVIPILLLSCQIRDFNGLRKNLNAEHLTFLLTALIVIPAALWLDPFYPAYEILLLPLLEEWFFRGLLLSTLAILNTPAAISISSLMFTIAHYFHYEPSAFFSFLIFGAVLATLQARYKSIFLPMSIHVFWNWYAEYGRQILYGSGLTYFGGLAVGISYVFAWLIRKIWERI